MPKKTALQKALETDRDSLLREIETIRTEVQVIESNPLIVNKKMATSSRLRRLATLEKAAKQRGIEIESEEEPQEIDIIADDFSLPKFHEFANNFCKKCSKHKTGKRSLPCYIRGGLQRIAAWPDGLAAGHYRVPAEIVKLEGRGMICTALKLKKK